MAEETKFNEEQQKAYEEACHELCQALMGTPTFLDRFMALDRQCEELGGDLCGFLLSAIEDRFEALTLPSLDEVIVAAVKAGAKLQRPI